MVDKSCISEQDHLINQTDSTLHFANMLSQNFYYCASLHKQQPNSGTSTLSGTLIIIWLQANQSLLISCIPCACLDMTQPGIKSMTLATKAFYHQTNEACANHSMHFYPYRLLFFYLAPLTTGSIFIFILFLILSTSLPNSNQSVPSWNTMRISSLKNHIDRYCIMTAVQIEWKSDRKITSYSIFSW